jgi:hypothetical protein
MLFAFYYICIIMNQPRITTAAELARYRLQSNAPYEPSVWKIEYVCMVEHQFRISISLRHISDNKRIALVVIKCDAETGCHAVAALSIQVGTYLAPIFRLGDNTGQNSGETSHLHAVKQAIAKINLPPLIQKNINAQIPLHGDTKVYGGKQMLSTLLKVLCTMYPEMRIYTMANCVKRLHLPSDVKQNIWSYLV